VRNPFQKMMPGSKDRNARAILQVAEGQFAARVHAGELNALDRLGRKLQKGALVVWRPEQETVWEVVDIAPVLDPSAPQGFIRVTLAAGGTLNAFANNVQPHVIIVGQRAPEPDAILPPGEHDPRD
jgi:hypothetical protein